MPPPPDALLIQILAQDAMVALTLASDGPAGPDQAIAWIHQQANERHLSPATVGFQISIILATLIAAVCLNDTQELTEVIDRYCDAVPNSEIKDQIVYTSIALMQRKPIGRMALILWTQLYDHPDLMWQTIVAAIGACLQLFGVLANDTGMPLPTIMQMMGVAQAQNSQH